MSLRPRYLSYCVAAALAAMANGASAGPIEMFAQSSGTLGNPGVAIPTNRDPAVGTNTTGVDVLSSHTDAAGNNLFFHSYGANFNGFTFFGSRASGGGIYDGTGQFFLQQDFTVSGGPTAHVFNFTVDNGEVSANCAPCTSIDGTDPAGTAMFQIHIALDDLNDGNPNPVQTHNGDVNLIVNSDGSTAFTRTGLATMLNGIDFNGVTGPTLSLHSFNGGLRDWGSTPFSLALGLLNPSDYRVSYELIAKVSGRFASSTVTCSDTGFFGQFDFGQEGYGPDVKELNQNTGEARLQPAAVGEGGFFCTGWTPGTTARSGDPIGNSRTVAGIQAVPGAVPEPGSGALFALGLAAGAAVVGRRKRKPKS